MTTTAGKWSDPDIPNSGWKFVRMRVLRNDGRKKCEMHCGANIKFIHQMRHPATHLNMEVGKCCAGNMEGDPAAAEERQKSTEATARRVRKRAKTLAMNQQAFDRINIETPRYYRLVKVVIPRLHRLQAETKRHIREAEKDSEAYESDDFAEQVLDQQAFLSTIEIALAGAQSRVPELLPEKAKEDLLEELKSARSAWVFEDVLMNDEWRSTKKGYRFESSQGDEAQVYWGHKGGWRGYVTPAGAEKPTHSGPLDADLEKAIRKCINALGTDLRAAGRLPAR